MKRLCLYSLVIGLLLTGCGEHPSETIQLFGHSTWSYDNTMLHLKNGYYVSDYSINYEDKTIMMNLEKGEE